MARVGRPPTPEDEQLVTVICLMNKHVDMLDREILERAERDLRSVVVTQPETKIPWTNVTVTTSRVDEINYASERRKLVGDLIEQALTTELRYPTSVVPNVPPGPYSDLELFGISDWAGQESVRRTASAPVPRRAPRAPRPPERARYVRRRAPLPLIETGAISDGLASPLPTTMGARPHAALARTATSSRFTLADFQRREPLTLVTPADRVGATTIWDVPCS